MVGALLRDSNFVLVLADRFVHPGPAHGHLSLRGKAPVKDLRDSTACPRLAHQRFQADDRSPDPERLGLGWEPWGLRFAEPAIGISRSVQRKTEETNEAGNQRDEGDEHRGILVL